MEELGNSVCTNLEHFPLLLEYVDVFELIPCLPPKRDTNSYINLIGITTSLTKSPYRMSTPKWRATNENGIHFIDVVKPAPKIEEKRDQRLRN